MNIPSFPSIKSTESDRKIKEGLAAALKEKERRHQRKIQSERGGLLEFVRYFWEITDPFTKFIEGWTFEAICLHLEAVTHGEINRLLMNVPPGFSKPIHVKEEIITLNGPKLLSEIVVGDHVLTHKGRYRKVLAVHEQGILPLLRTKTKYGFSTSTANDHPYLTLRGWIRADELLVGDNSHLGDYLTSIKGDPRLGKFQPDKLLSIEPDGEGECRCLTVADDHSFTSGGLVVHNTLLTQVFWPAWEWSAMGKPGLRYVAFSYSSGITEHSNEIFCKLVQSEKFRDLWGEIFTITAEGKVRISNNKTGWKFASSVGGIGTGVRGDRVIIDDAHNVIDSESTIVREDTCRWFEESAQNRLNDLRRSAIVVIMQRVNELDVSGVILEKFPNYEHLMIPMAHELDRHCITSIGWEDPRTKEGELAWPERFPDEVIRSFRENEYLWAGQYQQRPQLRGSAILKSEYWQPWDEESSVENGVKYGLYPPFEYVVGCLDTAMTEKKQNDPSAFIALGVWRNKNNNRRIMLIYAWTERFEFHDLINQIVRACKKCKITLDKLLVEAKANGHSVEQELRRLHQNNAYEAGNPLALTSIQLWNPGRGDKVSRAMAIQPIMERRVVFYPTRTGEDGSIIPRVWAQAVERQASSFPRGKHDDLVDCLTMGLAHLRLIGMIATPEEEREVLRQELSDYKTPLPLYPGA